MTASPWRISRKMQSLSAYILTTRVNAKTHGFETYYHSGASVDLANRIQQKLMTIPNSANGGIHTANFRVLRLANCPAVLVECGYLSNRSEGNQARDSEYRELLADRIAEAIVEAALRSRSLSAASSNRCPITPAGGTRQQRHQPRASRLTVKFGSEY